MFYFNQPTVLSKSPNGFVSVTTVLSKLPHCVVPVNKRFYRSQNSFVQVKKQFYPRYQQRQLKITDYNATNTLFAHLSLIYFKLMCKYGSAISEDNVDTI